MITTARYFATRLIGDFCRLHPRIELIMEVVNRDQMLERMAHNRDDLYIMGRTPRTWRSRPCPIAENPLVVVAAADHPLCSARDICAGSLENQPFSCASRARAPARRRSAFSPATRSARRRA